MTMDNSSSWWRISFGWIGVLQQQVNLIRRFLSNAQTPDSVITLDGFPVALMR
jgi:hypothetical protein